MSMPVLDSASILLALALLLNKVHAHQTQGNPA